MDSKPSPAWEDAQKVHLLPGSVVSGMAQAPGWKGKVHIKSAVPGNDVTLCGKWFDPTLPADMREVEEWGYCARCLRVYRQAGGQPWS